MSGQTCQVFVAPAQDPEPANQIAATRKLISSRPLMTIRQGSESFFLLNTM